MKDLHLIITQLVAELPAEQGRTVRRIADRGVGVLRKALVQIEAEHTDPDVVAAAAVAIAAIDA